MGHELGFGKHGNRSLEWLFFNDPGYVWWMVRTGATKQLSGKAAERFDDLVRRARHLRISGPCRQCRESPVSRMFLTQHISGGLARIDFHCDKCVYEGGSPSTPMKPAFYTPDIYRGYDKTGGKFLVDAIKRAYYGPKKPRMTQKKMEEFFDSEDHFVDF